MSTSGISLVKFLNNWPLWRVLKTGLKARYLPFQYHGVRKHAIFTVQLGREYVCLCPWSWLYRANKTGMTGGWDDLQPYIQSCWLGHWQPRKDRVGRPWLGAYLPRPMWADKQPWFQSTLCDMELAHLSHKNFSDETMKQVHWVHKMYHEWCNYRHSNGFDQITCDLEDKAMITVESLKFALCQFITEVKRLDRKYFPGKTLHHLIICIQFHLECLGFAFKLVNNPAFCDVKFTLDNTMKACVRQGIGISVKRAEVLTATNKDLLWSMELLGMAYPEQLLNTVIFCIRKGFALRAGQEHRALRGLPFNSQFKFMHDTDGEIFLWYMEDIGLKTNKGGLKHRKIEAKTVDLYGSANTERCPLQAIIRYLSFLPKNRSCMAFYLQPWKKFFGKAWYINCPAGINRLCTAVGSMCQEAGLPGHYTNHSLHSTAATKKITGHHSLAMRAYKRTSEWQKKQASKYLFGPVWSNSVAHPLTTLRLNGFAFSGRAQRPMSLLLCCRLLLNTPHDWNGSCLCYLLFKFSVK